jgi:hypothetical protein
MLKILISITILLTILQHSQPAPSEPHNSTKVLDSICENNAEPPFCCENGAKNADCCLNDGFGKYCCPNGSDNQLCCENWEDDPTCGWDLVDYVV